MNLKRLAAWLALWLGLTACGSLPASPTATLSNLPSAAPTALPSAIIESTASAPTPGLSAPQRDVFFFSAQENGYQHLFAYAPGSLPLTRLTAGEWDDITPALSPDGSRLAFASNRNNYFDLYLLDLSSGQITRLTDNPDYEASPSWSPDGVWLTYEAYRNDNFEIFLLSTQQPEEVIPLTADPASDQTPAWAPGGRSIAFASDRGGQTQIWTANLDTPGENRFQLVSPQPESEQMRPAWSPDGRYLAWETRAEGLPNQIRVWDSANPLAPARVLGTGASPAWSSDGQQIAAAQEEPNLTYLSAYGLDGSLRLPPLVFPALRGLCLGSGSFSQMPQIFSRFAVSPTPLFEVERQSSEENPLGRAALIPLFGVDAPQPRLHDEVDESFAALRSRVAREAGWDVLASLENAYTPLTSALAPGRGDSWLYTGRAFDINPLPLSVGWMQVYREDYNGETYWRLFLRPQAQDGSAGEPLRLRPWDFSARYNLNPLAYEQGGKRMSSLPTGYWLDVTSLARAYGWQRPAALTTWRTYFGGALFNEFIQPGSLTWREAMLELYPPEALITPSPIVPPTRTPTPTPTGYRYKTATPTVTFTPTRQPTFTPQP